MHIVLINPYELGRQPFGLAEPAAWLAREGFEVTCIDLSLERLDPERMAGAGLVCLYLGMHTATRIALAALPRIREIVPTAKLCAYGLYAPVNETLLRGLGIGTVLGGEFEPGLVSTAHRVARGIADGEANGSGSDGDAPQTEPVVSTAKVDFVTPRRQILPSIERYAHLIEPAGDERVVGFAEASRGCKHLCRHCPVVPVYGGRFRVVPVDVVLADIAQQIADGATHISFGDPDFLNGPTHARRVVEALHAAHPTLTYDATIKVEHLIAHGELLPTLAATGCSFIISAVESVDDAVLERLDKGHRADDFDRAAERVREAGITLSPTFVPFTPWTTLDGYLELLNRLARLRLVENVPPVQLAIRLLVPSGSRLLELPGFTEAIEPFDPATLGYPWRHVDPRVDRLQLAVQAIAEASETQGLARRVSFERIWEAAHQALDRPVPELPADLGVAGPRLSEPWYCCAEPTDEQLMAF